MRQHRDVHLLERVTLQQSCVIQNVLFVCSETLVSQKFAITIQNVECDIFIMNSPLGQIQMRNFLAPIRV